MYKNILIDCVNYKVSSLESGSDSYNIEVSGTVEINGMTESCIDFTFEYNKKTELNHFMINDMDILDIEDFDMSDSDFIDFIYDALPIEDIEKEVNENYEAFIQEEKDNLEYLKYNDPNEYIHQMKNNFGGFLYE